MLSNDRRRYVLSLLQDRSRASIRDLSRELAAWENDVDPAAVSSKQRKRVYIALHQTHLPRLDEYGVVTYDRDRGEVRATERLGIFAPYLGDGPTAEPNWARFYAGIGLATILLAAGLLVDLPIVAALDTGLVGLLLGTLLVTVAGLQAAGADRGDLPAVPPLGRPERAPVDE